MNCLVVLACLQALDFRPSEPTEGFANWETPHVHPLDLNADGSTLLAVNTADARLLIFDASGPAPALLADVPVGLEPVSVRWQGEGRAWVVNHVSDTITVVDVDEARVIETIATGDEPCDVVFAGTPARAFVTCSQANVVQVFALDGTTGLPTGSPAEIAIEAEDPRALAVSPDGATVYAAIFESGNGTTILSGGSLLAAGSYPLNAVNDSAGPWGGVNPPPNDGTGFAPGLSSGLPVAPKVGLVVRKDSLGSWFDDNGGDWTRLVTGDLADRSGRLTGWDVLDRDVVAIDAATLQPRYLGGHLNTAMALAVRPSDGRVTVVGTEALNEVRFEPNLEGRFVTVELASFDFAVPPVGPSSTANLNPHLDPSSSSVPAAARVASIGDPRAISWQVDGARGWVAGMGSNNVIAIDASSGRLGPPIPVGQGPTGLALDEAKGRLFVLERFDAAIAVIDTATASVVSRTPYFDPTPAAVRLGRPFLYDTHLTSGTGSVSCASCHIDARTDRLAWDLGDPSGEVVPFDANCRDNNCQDWHPMKGPMLTQTLQDIVGKEPHHWRGDRAGVEAFAPAFHTILGDDANLGVEDMQRFEDFLATIRFPPNPHRTLENELPAAVDMAGHYTTGRFSPPGQPLPEGNAQRGLELYRPPNFLDGVSCSNCHTLPTGMGSDTTLIAGQFVMNPVGPLGERHHPITSGDGSSQLHFKIPQLRNLHERTGFDTTQLTNTAGFGFLHDGSSDSIARFVGQIAFNVQGDQDIADLTAFMLSFAGSNLPVGSPTNLDEPPGPASFDTHAGVGAQVTVFGDGPAMQARLARLDRLEDIARGGEVALMAKGHIDGLPRGFLFDGASYQSDREGDVRPTASLRAAAGPNAPITFTVVVLETGTRMAIDRDLDGAFDRDELDAGSDPLDENSRPLGTRYCSPAVANSTGKPSRIDATGSDDVADGSFRLRATALPQNAFGYFLNSRSGGLIVGPGGSAGNLCVTGSIGRFNAQVQTSGTAGSFAISVNLMALPRPQGAVAIVPGETWFFQAWHRDLGGTTNFTDAIEVAFR